jgi:hypothetical protein
MQNIQARSLGGWALLINAGVGALLLLVDLTNIGMATPLAVLHLLALALFLLGLPAIQATQPQTGRAGQLGLTLMGLAAAIAFIVVLLALAGVEDVGPVIPLMSALSGLVGDLLIGFLTVRAGTFPAWTGWLLALAGAANFGIGLFSGAADLSLAAALGSLLGIAAIAGYGWTIVQHLEAVRNARQVT